MPPEETNDETQNTSTSEATPPDISGLLKALDSERDNRKKLEKELRERNAKERELNETLERYKSIDPAKYAELIAKDQERQEEELKKNQEWEKLKGRYQQEADVLRKDSQNWQTRYQQLTVETAIRNAFFENGGKKMGVEVDEGEEIPPVEAILNILRDRIQYEEGKLIILGRDGKPELAKDGRNKSLSEKMQELRKGSMGALFESQSNASGGGASGSVSYNGQQLKLYSRDQARSGRASIDDIAQGKAIVR